MRTLLLATMLLAPLAWAGGPLKDAKAALRGAQELADDSDASCARALQRKLGALEDDLADVKAGELRATKVRGRVTEVHDWVDHECPRKLARQVGEELEALADALEDHHEDQRDERPRGGRDDDRPRRRDCGTGDDPGCSMQRGGQLPMDAETYRGFLASVQSNPNELTKLDQVRRVLSNNTLTARQLGPVLDAFRNELLKLDAAKAAAPKVVNPAHALGHASKFRNSLLAGDYTQVMTR